MKLTNLILAFVLAAFSSCAQTASKKEAASLADSAYKSLFSPNSPHSLHKAILYADQSIKLDSSRSLAYNLKSTALTMLQKPDLAIEPLSVWLNKHPDDNEFLIRRGLIYEKLGKSAESEKDFAAISKMLEAKVSKVSSGMTEAEIGETVTAATFYFLIGKSASASAILSSLQKTYPNDQKLRTAATEILKQDRGKLIYSILGF